jgi:hypothetical protein
MPSRIPIVYVLSWFYRLLRRLTRQRQFPIRFILYIILIFILFLYLWLPPLSRTAVIHQGKCIGYNIQRDRTINKT